VKRWSNPKPRRSSDIIDHASSDLYRGQSSFDHQRGYHNQAGSYHGLQRTQDQTHYHDRSDGYSDHQSTYDSQDRTTNYHNQKSYLSSQKVCQGSLDRHIDSEQSINSKWTGSSDQWCYNDIKISSSATADSSENTRKDYG